MLCGLDGKYRCFGNEPGKEFYAHYHDTEWGIPSHEDHHLFEMLILEGAQAGLNWETILKKREGYRRAFHNFDPQLVAAMTDGQLEKLRENPEIIRNRLKIHGTRRNAICFLKIIEEFGSFNTYIWNFIDHKPIINTWKSLKELPASSSQSEALSQDLRKRGMTFVGSTIMYAFMQATGMVDDHLEGCWKRCA